MNGPLTPERARELLEAQLDELGALRNAHARDPRFKQWRQATLTLIQRIWPGDTARAERFRRVPFSPPSSKMTAKATRSFFEKGCAEAVQLIRSMFPALRGAVARPSRPDNDSGPAPGEIEDDFPVVELPGATEMADDEKDDGIEIPPASPVKPESRRPASPGIRPRDEDPPAPTGKVQMRSSSRPSSPLTPLRELLGFPSHPVEDNDPQPAASGRDDESGFDEDTMAAESHTEWQIDEMDAGSSDSASDPDRWEAPEEFQLPARPRRIHDEDEAAPIIEMEPEGFPPPRPAREESDEPVAENESGPEDTGDVMAEFLRTSPVLKASARPVRRKDAGAPPAPSPTAASLVALASEVAQLGVPEGQRAGMRATLIELARRVDERSLEWDTLRESFHAVLDFPPLARRVIPLLIPYLDAAA